MTLIVNIGLPAFFLATSVGSDSVIRFTPIFSDPATVLKTLTLLPLSLFRGFERGDFSSALITFAKLAVGVVLKGIPRLVELIALYIGSNAALQAAPIIGWGIKVARIGAAIAEIAQTVVEVTSGPAVFDDMIEFSMVTKVTIKHDPKNFQFPATAVRYVLSISFAEGVGQEIKRDLPPGVISDPSDEMFTDTPVGGEAIHGVATAKTFWSGMGPSSPIRTSRTPASAVSARSRSKSGWCR
jgi:hypothetical protein